MLSLPGAMRDHGFGLRHEAEGAMVYQVPPAPPPGARWASHRRQPAGQQMTPAQAKAIVSGEHRARREAGALANGGHGHGKGHDKGKRGKGTDKGKGPAHVRDVLAYHDWKTTNAAANHAAAAPPHAEGTPRQARACQLSLKRCKGARGCLCPKTARGVV